MQNNVANSIITPSPSFQLFHDICSRLDICSIKNIAKEFNVSQFEVWHWIKSDELFSDCYHFYATHYKHFLSFETINNVEFLQQNPLLAQWFIRRSIDANKFGFISDKDLKELELDRKLETANVNKRRLSFIPNLNFTYYSLLNTTSRYVIVFGGAGSGKSYAVADWLLYRIYNSDTNIRILYGRKNFTHIKQSQFALLKSRISYYNLDDEFSINKTDYRITCKHNNAELIAIGLDDPEKIKSIFDPVAVWIEEATELKFDDFQQLDLRLRSKVDNLQIIFTFNPVSKKHFLKQTFVQDDVINLGEPVTKSNIITFDDNSIELETFILKTNYKHNKHLPAQYIAALEKMKTTNPDGYNIYVNAEWGDAGQGWLFKRDFFDEYTELPADARGVVYCDPNLAKKGQGDTTAITKLLYSPSTQLYYVEDVICKSYSDANALLKDLFNMYHNDTRLIGLSFDGNVAQESQWTQHIRNFAILYNTTVPVIDYKRYHVDDLSKNASMLWAEGRIKFRKGIKETTDGDSYISQLFSFIGKKHSRTSNNVNDDAPDSLICAIQTLFDRGYRCTTNNLTDIKGLI